MIFVTVGSVLPFDRLIAAVDDWAASRKRKDVFAQVGRSGIKPKYIEYTKFLEPSEYHRVFAKAQVTVAHAGIGTIQTAFELRKPILVMPRRADLLEHTSDHQMATARTFAQKGWVSVAYDEVALADLLDKIDQFQFCFRPDDGSSDNLLATVREFINEQ